MDGVVVGGVGGGGGVAAAWANPRGARLRCRGLPLLSLHLCHLSAAGLFYIMHGQHVRRTLVHNEDQQPCVADTSNTRSSS